jgi:hypothetical protein
MPKSEFVGRLRMRMKGAVMPHAVHGGVLAG